MKTIEEIMGLVDKQVEMKAALYIVQNFMLAKRFHEEMKVNRANIEAALRELVERNPLEDSEMWGVVCSRIDANEFSAFELNEMFEIGRSVERAHKIGA